MNGLRSSILRRLGFRWTLPSAEARMLQVVTISLLAYKAECH